MTSLKKFYNKNIHIIATNDKRFVGKVIEYVYPEDNENEMESIIIEDSVSNNLVEFYEKDIKSITIV